MESTHNRKLKELLLVVVLIVLLPILLLVGSFFVKKRSDDSLETIASRQTKTAKPLKTNSWFTTLYDFPSYPVFAYPGAYKVDTQGLGISYPQVTATENTVFAPYVENCLISYEAPLETSTVIDYGDWHVVSEFETNKGKGTITIVQGSPFVYTTYAGSIFVECPSSELERVEDNAYLARTETGLFLIQSEGLTLDGSKFSTSETLRVAILPNGETLERFLQEKWITDPHTEVKWTVEDSTVTTTLTFPTSDFLTTIWPHHKSTLQNESQTLGTYQTVLGSMDVVSTNDLKFSQQISLPSSGIKPVVNGDKEKILESLNNDIDQFSQLNYADGVYSKGTQLGALASLIELTAAYEPQRLDEIVDVLQRELTATNGTLSYDPQKKMYVSLNSEFGNKEGNDHHFHYGYYIRAASVLVKYRPDQLSVIQGMIDEMIGDIATIEPSDRYPRLRNFSPYEGHSWADGLGDFADGNNLESTSESLNAWYSLYLWGTVTKDQTLADTGLWLYSQELQGVLAYWWGVDNAFPEGYQHEIASIVWGGKRDFSTWFSGEPLHIYGIQMLPITNGSSYLQTLSENSSYSNEIQELNSDPYAHEWGDLYAAFVSYSNPTAAISNLPRVTSTSGMKLKSLLLHTVYSNFEQ